MILLNITLLWLVTIIICNLWFNINIIYYDNIEKTILFKSIAILYFNIITQDYNIL